MNKRFCIFDMDGTLVDSMHYWKGLGRDYLESLGIHTEEHLLGMVKTMTMLEGAAYFMDTFRIPGPPQRIVDEMEAMMEEHYRRDVPLKPWVKAYLERLRERGCRLCVATATNEALSRQCLSRLGVDGLFDFIISCETLGVSKDKPDVYLEAARRLGADPGETAVFEDAPYAARTAKEAGFYTVAVPEPSYAGDWPALSALADECIPDWRNAV